MTLPDLDLDVVDDVIEQKDQRIAELEDEVKELRCEANQRSANPFADYGQLDEAPTFEAP